ncbi:MAG: hypothetical protein Q9180_008073, partial [Flavoplaca navasiana]
TRSQANVLVNHKTPRLTFHNLPLEIQNEILSYLITFEHLFDLTLKECAWDAIIYQALQYYGEKWPVIHLLTPQYRFFYRYNTVRVFETDISTLLNHQSFPLVDQKAYENPPLVSITMDKTLRYYLASVIICIRTMFRPRNPDPGALLPELFSCPSLKILLIDYQEFDSMDHFDGEFKKIENFMMALAEKLGPEMVKVEGTYRTERGYVRLRRFVWTMAEFRNGRFEGSEKWRGVGSHESDDTYF